MVRQLIPVLALALGACASVSPAPALQARIAPDVALTLPMPPNYPDTRTIVQLGRARYGERQAAFEAVVSLSPADVQIVITVPGGPRLATISWTARGVRQERTLLVPTGLPVENILSDIFISEWPEAAVRAALPDGVTLTVGADGVRTLTRGDAVIETVTPDADAPGRVVVRNLAFGYEVSIVSQRQG